jgi:outer membrane biogenesis lipoprotein LolB
MRLLLLVVCFILTACTSTSKSDNYFRATGTGNTCEEAKLNAFKEAIEYQVGVVIASERESYNEKLIKNEILA